jgi:RNA exonuclease 1
MSALVDHGNPSGWHGKKADKCIGCSDDAEVVDGIRGLLSGESDEEGEEEKDGEYKLIFGRLTGLASALGCGYFVCWRLSRR